MEIQVCSYDRSSMDEIFSNHLLFLEKYHDLSACENKIQKLCELEQSFSKETQILSDLPSVEIEELERIYKELLKEAMNVNLKDSDRFRRFEKDIEDIKFYKDGQSTTQVQNTSTSRTRKSLTAEDDEMEIETTENDTNFVDPITKTKITNPVRHKVCNHIYDLVSITAAIKNSRKMR